MRARYRRIFSLSCPVSNHKQKWRLLCLVWSRFASVVDVFTLDYRAEKLNGLYDNPQFRRPTNSCDNIGSCALRRKVREPFVVVIMYCGGFFFVCFCLVRCLLLVKEILKIRCGTRTASGLSRSLIYIFVWFLWVSPLSAVDVVR